MKQILDKLEQSDHWKKIMRESCKKNGLKTSLVNQLTLVKLRTIDSKLAKSYTHLGEKAATQWLQNELRTFQWLLVGISAFSKNNILEFQNEQWELLQTVFKNKNQCFLKFQARKLALSCSKTNKNWTQQQSDLLKQVLPNFKDEQGYVWNEIARKMFELSEQKIFKTGKHCRERWLNHLDPTKQRGEWTVEQDLILLDKVYQSGKKWSQFATLLNRTEHSVKNRFNSLLIKKKRLNPEIKEQKLIKLVRKMLEDNQNKSLQQMDQEQIQDQEQIVEHSADLGISIQQKVQLVQEQKGGNSEKNNTDELQSEQKEEQKERGDQRANNTALEFLQYVREEQQIKNLVGVTTECHPAIYSPYCSYSPNGTPNNFMNSTSPLSYYLNYNFTNCFARFTSQLPNFSANNTEQNT